MTLRALIESAIVALTIATIICVASELIAGFATRCGVFVDCSGVF